MAKNKILCKDGGFATQLSVHVGEKIDGNPLWSARFNAINPDAVIKTHLDFLKAGADIILTNTYQASVEGYIKYLGLNTEQSINLIKSTVKLAHIARDTFLKEIIDNNEHNVSPLIVASIGPYGAHLHDGSEYTGSYADYVEPQTISNWHRTRIDAVLEAGVDALAIETIPCQVEAEAIVDLLCNEYPNVKFWISLQCKVNGSSLAHGEMFKDAFLALRDKLEKKQATQNCLAIGVNCLHPKFVTPLFESLNNLNDESKLPLIVYPNSGEVYDVINGWTGKEDCISLEEYVPTWINLGAKIIGGCCRTYARDVYKIKECLKKLEKLN